LGALALPAKLTEELDRLPPLSKLDYYLNSHTASHIDRGCRETECVSEVLKLRDHIVHPKLISGSIAGVEGDRYVDYGVKEVLGIALDNREWSHEDGMKVANAVTNFLRVFFLDWCGHTKGNITRLLVCRERDLLRRELAMWVQMPDAEVQLIQKWLPAALTFVDLRPSQNDA